MEDDSTDQRSGGNGDSTSALSGHVYETNKLDTLASHGGTISAHNSVTQVPQKGPLMMFGIFSPEVEFLIVVLGIVIAICALMFICAVAYFCFLRKHGELSENPWDRRKVTLRKYRLLQPNPPRPSRVCLASERVYKWPWQSNGRNYIPLEGSCFSDPQSTGNYQYRPPPSPASSDGAYKTPVDEEHCRCIMIQQLSHAPLPTTSSTSSKPQLSQAPVAQWSTKRPLVEPTAIYADSASASASATKGAKERKHRKKHRDGSDTTDSETKHDRRAQKKHRSKHNIDSVQ